MKQISWDRYEVCFSKDSYQSIDGDKFWYYKIDGIKQDNNKHCMNFYYECQLDRYKKLHDKEE